MATWAPAKKDTLEAIAREILHNYSRGRAIVAVDGMPGAGGHVFANELATSLTEVGLSEVYRSSIKDFRPSTEGFEADAADYDSFTRQLVTPFRARSGSPSFSLSPGAMAISAGADALLIVDGFFLNRAELRGLWNYSIWLTLSRTVADTRLPEGTAPDVVARESYWKAASPRETATAILDTTDPDHPRRVFADSC